MSTLPYYYFTQVANFGGLSEKGKTLAHFIGRHFRSTNIYMWTLLEVQVTNAIESQHICAQFWFVAKIWPIV